MTGSEDDDLLAAELALGLLEGEERSSAEIRESSDADFGALVEAWRERLSPMLGTAGETPSQQVWTGINARLAANDGPPLSPGEAALRRWRAFGISASAIAASLALVLVTRTPPAELPQPRPEAPGPTMVATLQGEDQAAIVTISASPDGRLLVTPVALPTDGRVPELWIIPDDGKPRSLGVIAASTSSRVKVAAANMPHVRRGATFAISQEPPGGSPTGAPTGPVIATGKINIV